MQNEPEAPTASTTACGTTPCARNALDAVLGCAGAVALIATALSAFFPDRVHAAAPVVDRPVAAVGLR